MRAPAALLLLCFFIAPILGDFDPFVFLEDSAENQAFHGQVFGSQEFVPGKLHEVEHVHYSPSQKLVRYHHAKFQLNSRLKNLDKKSLGIKNLKCSSSKKQISIEIPPGVSLPLSTNDYIYFGPRNGSGCHRHHKNGASAGNFFKLTKIVKEKTKSNGAQQVVAKFVIGKGNEMFESAKFAFYQEAFDSSHSEKMRFHEHFEDEESAGADHQDIVGFRKRNLPPHIHEIVRRYHDQSLESDAARERQYQKRDDDEVEPTGFTADIKKNVTGDKPLVERTLTLAVSTTIGPIKLTGSIKLTVTFSLVLETRRFSLIRFKYALVGSLGGGISASLDVGNLLNDAGISLPSAKITFPIPTPVPLLMITISPFIKVTASLDASISTKSGGGKLSLSGELGTNAEYIPGEGWKSVPMKGMNWNYAPPTDLSDAVGTVSLSIGPSIGVMFGASGALIIGLEGGPSIGFPVSLSISTSRQCRAKFAVKFSVALRIGVNFNILTVAVVSGSYGQDLYSKTVYEKCLIEGNPGSVGVGDGIAGTIPDEEPTKKKERDRSCWM